MSEIIKKQDNGKSYWSGKKRPPFSDETIKNMSNAVKKRHQETSFGFKSKENNPKWKGGISETQGNFRIAYPYRKWRKLVLERDNYTCRFCGERKKVMHVDHIRPIESHPDLILDEDNGRTLCPECHKKVTWPTDAKVDTREGFVDGLIELAENDERIYVLTCDVGFKILDKFRERFPERYINLGVTEQSTMIIATAMALSGLRPVFYSMVNFSIFRPYEMLRNGVCYHNAPVLVAGVSGSKAYRFLGFSHNYKKNEDIDLIWRLPNLRISLPRDNKESKKNTIEALNYKGPTYIRL